MALFHQNANQALNEINNILNNIENNRMRQEIDNIINRNPLRVFINQRIYYNENGITRSVPYIYPDNWHNHYNENPNNNNENRYENFNTIQICFEHTIITSVLELIDKIIRRNNLYAIQYENIEGWNDGMEYVQADINFLTQHIINTSNIYLGILLEHDDIVQN